MHDSSCPQISSRDLDDCRYLLTFQRVDSVQDWWHEIASTPKHTASRHNLEGFLDFSVWVPNNISQQGLSCCVMAEDWERQPRRQRPSTTGGSGVPSGVSSGGMWARRTRSSSRTWSLENSGFLDVFQSQEANIYGNSEGTSSIEEFTPLLGTLERTFLSIKLLRQVGDMLKMTVNEAREMRKQVAEFFLD